MRESHKVNNMQANIFKDDEFGIKASSFTPNKNISIPDMKNNKIVTLNKQGFMRLDSDICSDKWVELARKNSGYYLELGAAYGETSLRALKASAESKIISNDIEIKHLEILANRTDIKYKDRLILNCSAFPENFQIPNNSINAVLFCRLGHFFTTKQMLASLTKIHNILLPGGDLFFTALAPYHYSLKEKFLPTFLERLKQDDPNPGYISDMSIYMPDPNSSKFVPKFMNCFSPQSLDKLIDKSLFELKTLSLWDYATNNSNGQGFTIMHLRKK